jgi:hypothetical protein
MADEGFLQRWSRRKAATRTPLGEPEAGSDATPEQELPPTAMPQGPVIATEAPFPADTAAAVDLDALPEIDSLTYESDFTVFMRQGVPLELRNRALRRLWRSDPTLANLDGLLEYGEDYSKLGTTRQVVRTIYQVGRGMLDRAEAASEDTISAAAAPTAPTDQRAPMPAPDLPAAGAPDPAAPAADPPAVEGAAAAIATATTREADAPRAGLAEARQRRRTRPAKKPRRLPKRHP